jgi:ABC-type transport system involved in multi-copper enzyme maturation permease subunit
LRVAYLGVLLAFLLLFYYLWLPVERRPPLFEQGSMTIQSLAEFGASFFGAVMLAQFLAVFILTPIYTAGAIAEETERHTLEFLLASQLSNREIVLGKLLARMAHMGLLLMTGLPVLGLLQLLGGVDPDLVLTGFVACGVLMLSLASLGVWTSLHHSTALGALHQIYGLAGAYLLGTGLCFGWGPPIFNLGNPVSGAVQIFRALEKGENQGEVLLGAAIGFVPVHLAFALGFTVSAIRRLRTRGNRDTAPVVPKPASVSERERPPLNEDNPLLWKELSEEPIIPVDWRARKPQYARNIFAVGVPLTLALAIALANDPRGKFLNLQVRLLGTIFSLIGFLFVGLCAVGRFSREIERQTLDALLLLPDRECILDTKRYASARSVFPVAATLLYLWLVGVVGGGLHLFALVLLLLACGVYALFFINLGIWLSLATRATVRAALLFCVCVVAFPAVAWGGLAAANQDLIRCPEFAAGLHQHGCGLVPPWTIWTLSFRHATEETLYTDSEQVASRLLLTGAGLLLYLLAAWGLAWRARVRFDTLQGPRPGDEPERGDS